MERDLRIYVLIRTDIEMPSGKLAVQAMHAVLGLYQKCLEQLPDLTKAYRNTALQFKICLEAKNLHVIERAGHECEEASIPTFLVKDAGLTVFSEPTITALAVGPVLKQNLPRYIQRLQLLG